jgi:RNA polymerase sigma-70 factor, ECF subfamily
MRRPGGSLACAAAPSCRCLPPTDDRVPVWRGVMIGPLFPEVLAAAQGGDEQAFAVLWRELQPAVLRYFQVAAAQAAEDLAADTWRSVIGGLGRFRGDERAFRAWVCSPWPATGPSTGTARQGGGQPQRSRLSGWPGGRCPTIRSPRCWRGNRPGRRWRCWPSCPPIRPRWRPCGCMAGWRFAEVARTVGKRPGAVRVMARRGCGAWPNEWRRRGWRGV